MSRAERRRASTDSKYQDNLQDEVKRLHDQVEDMEKAVQDKTKAIDALKKKLEEEVGRARESARQLQEKFGEEMEREKQAAQAENAKINQMIVEARAKAENDLRAQRDAGERKAQETRNRTRNETAEVQRRADDGQRSLAQGLSWDIQRLERLIDQEESSRRDADSRANQLQKGVNSWETEVGQTRKQIRSAEKELGMCEQEVVEVMRLLESAWDTEDKLKKRLQRLI